MSYFWHDVYFLDSLHYGIRTRYVLRPQVRSAPSISPLSPGSNLRKLLLALPEGFRTSPLAVAMPVRRVAAKRVKRRRPQTVVLKQKLAPTTVMPKLSPDLIPATTHQRTTHHAPAHLTSSTGTAREPAEEQRDSRE